MHFHGPVIRPHTDADSLFIEVTSSCSHNACRYCTYYKDAPFAVSPEEEIREDLRELASYKIPFRRIWLQGADPFLLSAARLARIAALIHEAFPSVQSIGGYGRADSLRNKTVEELKKRKDLGYTGIVFDVESADEEILTFMNKGYHASEIVPQLSKMDEAGLAYEIIYPGGPWRRGAGNPEREGLRRCPQPAPSGPDPDPEPHHFSGHPADAGSPKRRLPGDLRGRADPGDPDLSAGAYY